jgi:hypothetical protein
MRSRYGEFAKPGNTNPIDKVVAEQQKTNRILGDWKPTMEAFLEGFKPL